ncbi:PEP/pyruvate-binding domain-containing protein [Desmospora activa]|uniref:Pyruvate,water dikinase n=1 Tax=Desmospora activa DSM 45169 TaxID=1121389 RepID=A0A2T4Z766_9BACL|nr:PEP/pyruvate-binding domain-containing protein [Desmospora activa]PTM57747.1 pyruvate,water dikinase [Desmospora activa DSM 45169]
MYTVSFGDIGQTDAKVGAKAENLSFLVEHGFPVPAGFVVTMDAFLRVLEENELCFENTEEWGQKLSTLQIPLEVQTELENAFQPLLDTYGSVAVRSSSEAEDLEGASFAGQYETFLHIRTFAELQEKLKACWASMFAPAVVQYLQQMEMDTTVLPMGVIVQGLVKSDVSGVIFSTNPVSNNAEEMMINASYGLGEGIVSGVVSPDLWTVRKEDGTTIAKELGSKEVEIHPDVRGTKTLATPLEDRDRFCLEEEPIFALVQLTQRIEELYGHAVDVEFALKDGQIYLLQARPITGLTAKPLSEFQQSITLGEAERQDGCWVQFDNLTGALTPLDASFLIPIVPVAMQAENQPMPMKMKLYKGHVYTFMSPPPGAEEMDMEKMMAEQYKKMAPLFPHLQQRMMDAINTHLLPQYRRFEEEAHNPLALEEAWKKVQELYEFHKKAWQVHFEVVIPQGALNMALAKTYQELLGEEDTTAVHELLTGTMNKFLETERELCKLAEQVKAEPELYALFRENEPEKLWSLLSNSAQGESFLAAVKDFLSVYGYRPIHDHRISETWVENPTHAMRAIASYVERDYDFDAEFQQGVEKRQARVEEVLRRIPEGEGKQRFMQLHQWALDAACVRDDHHFYIDAMLPAYSHLFLLNVGKTLVRHRVLAAPQDILYLYWDELLDCLQKPQSMVEEVERRKEEHHQNQHRSLPSYFGEIPAALKENPMMKELFGSIEVKSTDDLIVGNAASSGTYTGVVKVIQGPAEFGKLQEGEVLVCKTTTPTWMTLFATAGAVVTDGGGVLSHTGIIAREYGLPAVLGTKVATQRLQDGDKVMVDGTHGTVTVVEAVLNEAAATVAVRREERR